MQPADTPVEKDIGLAEDIAISTDSDSSEPLPEDASSADITEDVSGPEDSTTDTSTVSDGGPEDVGPWDVEPPCEGVNCPGNQAPSWALEDFQPQSPWFTLTYGLEQFAGKVTVMVLLAGW